NVLKQITVTTDRRIEVRWPVRQWHERWANYDLPSGVVALLALTLSEYASLLFETSAPEAPEEEMRALAARSRAERLAQVLVMRAQNEATDWTAAADAFHSEKAEGAWFVPTYSTATRAVLETGVVHPLNPVLAKAFDVIESLAIERTYRGV